MARPPYPPAPPPPVPGQQQGGGGGSIHQLPADWDATFGVTRILNKPDLDAITGDISSAEFEALIKVAFQIRSNPFTRTFVSALTSAADEAKLFVGQTAKYGSTQYLAVDKGDKSHTIDLIKAVDVIYIERGNQRLMARVLGVEDDSSDDTIRHIWLGPNLYSDHLESDGSFGVGSGVIYPLPIFTSLTEIPIVGQVFQANWAADASGTLEPGGYRLLKTGKAAFDPNTEQTPTLSAVKWIRLHKVSASAANITEDGEILSRFLELCRPGGNVWMRVLNVGVTVGNDYFIWLISGESEISLDGQYWDIPVQITSAHAGTLHIEKNYLFLINPRREQILGGNIITDINASMIDASRNAGSLGELTDTKYLLGSDSSNRVKSASLDDLNASILPYALTQITLTGYKYYRQGSGNANRNNAGSVFRINLNQYQIVPKSGDVQKLDETAFSPGHVMVFWVSAAQNVRVLVQSAGVLAGRKYFNFAQTVGIEITGTEPIDDTTIEIRGQSPHIAYGDISQTLNNSLFNVPSTHALDGKTLPSGGTTGQVLKKTATGFAWGDDASLDPEDQVPFAAAFRDVFTRTFVAALTATHGEAIVSNNNTKPSGAPDGTTDFVGVDRRTAANLDQNTQLSAISAGDWIRAKVGSNYLVAKIQHVEYNATEFAFYFWFNPSTDIADTLSYDQLGTGAGEIRFYTKSSGSGQSLTDSQIGDKAFSNPPSDLTNTEKSAVRSAIGVTVGGSNNFDLHDDVTTEVDTIADSDRFVISDESATGDPNKYVEFSDVKAAIGAPTGLPNAPANQSAVKKYELNVPANSGSATWVEAAAGGGGGNNVGASAYGIVGADGTLGTQSGLTSVARQSIGKYRVTMSSSRPGPDYSVIRFFNEKRLSRLSAIVDDRPGVAHAPGQNAPFPAQWGSSGIYTIAITDDGLGVLANSTSQYTYFKINAAGSIEYSGNKSATIDGSNLYGICAFGSSIWIFTSSTLGKCYTVTANANADHTYTRDNSRDVTIPSAVNFDYSSFRRNGIDTPDGITFYARSGSYTVAKFHRDGTLNDVDFVDLDDIGSADPANDISVNKVVCAHSHNILYVMGTSAIYQYGNEFAGFAFNNTTGARLIESDIIIGTSSLYYGFAITYTKSNNGLYWAKSSYYTYGSSPYVSRLRYYSGFSFFKTSKTLVSTGVWGAMFYVPEDDLLYVPNSATGVQKALALNPDSLEFQSGSDITLGFGDVVGATISTGKIWVLQDDSSAPKIKAINRSTKALVSADDITLPVGDYYGLVSDDVYIWALSKKTVNSNDVYYARAYLLSTGAYTSTKDFDLPSKAEGAFYDGVHIWFLLATKIIAYSRITYSHVPDLDLSLTLTTPKAATAGDRDWYLLDGNTLKKYLIGNREDSQPYSEISNRTLNTFDIEWRDPDLNDARVDTGFTMAIYG